MCDRCIEKCDHDCASDGKIVDEVCTICRHVIRDSILMSAQEDLADSIEEDMKSRFPAYADAIGVRMGRARKEIGIHAGLPENLLKNVSPESVTIEEFLGWLRSKDLFVCTRMGSFYSALTGIEMESLRQEFLGINPLSLSIERKAMGRMVRVEGDE